MKPSINITILLKNSKVKKLNSDFGVVQLGVVSASIFCIAFFFIFVVFYCTRDGIWKFSNGSVAEIISATLPNFDGLIYGSSNDIGSRFMEVNRCAEVCMGF